MIGILIFSISMAAIFVLIQMAITSSAQVKQEIIAANLLREEVELVKNLRDTNLRNFIPWDSIFLDRTTTDRFSSGYYIIENDFSANSEKVSLDPTTGHFVHSPVYMSHIFPTGIPPSVSDIFAGSRLYVDDYGRYSHMVSSKPALFASYIRVIPLEIPTLPSPLTIEMLDSSVTPAVPRSQAYEIEAKVIVSTPTFREYELNTIITDWKK